MKTIEITVEGGNKIVVVPKNVVSVVVAGSHYMQGYGIDALYVNGFEILTRPTAQQRELKKIANQIRAAIEEE